MSEQDLYSVELEFHKKEKKYVSWSNHYSMGIRTIDDQHKGLFDLVNNLFNHSTGRESEELVYFKNVIHAAVTYIKDHFATEEKYMLATKFYGYAEHKKAHDDFVKTVIQSVKDFEAGKRLVLKKFADFLMDWVLSHIAGKDLLYAQYFKKIATRKADGKLSITAADLALRLG